MSRMLTNKKYYFAVEPTKSCPLSFPGRWLYSFLIFRTSLNKPASRGMHLSQLRYFQSCSQELPWRTEGGRSPGRNQRPLPRQRTISGMLAVVCPEGQQRSVALVPTFRQLCHVCPQSAPGATAYPLGPAVAGVVAEAWQRVDHHSAIGVSHDVVSRHESHQCQTPNQPCRQEPAGQGAVGSTGGMSPCRRNITTCGVMPTIWPILAAGQTLATQACGSMSSVPWRTYACQFFFGNRYEMGMHWSAASDDEEGRLQPTANHRTTGTR